nr:swi5-dependent recombination DNA repair protein 1 homolog [Pogona vitticeps]XP_020644624.1 swi5-dependent recombination DNA repair protein 1 homolog [Pogona vitticeps]XP_020644625.1 swi5-dependent recombination DNA repair protein 1 homolog [Pogona vitticeps]
METVLNKPASRCSTPENCGTPAQNSSSSSSEKQLMSTTLRERLKKARRSFCSTFTVAKRLKIDKEKKSTVYEDGILSNEEPCSVSQDNDKCLGKVPAEPICLKSVVQEKELCLSVAAGCSKTSQNSTEANLLGTDFRQLELLDEKVTLVKQIQEKEELLRRLKLVKMYRSKNNPTELRSLISKWRSSSQAVLYELQSALSTDGRKLSITQLIDSLGLNDQLLRYDRTEEDFADV